VGDNEVKLSNYPSFAEAMVECWDRAPNVTLRIDRAEHMAPLVVEGFKGLTIAGMGTSKWPDSPWPPSEKSGILYTNPSTGPLLSFVDCEDLKIRDLCLQVAGSTEPLTGIDLTRCHKASLRDVMLYTAGHRGVGIHLKGSLRVSMFGLDTRGWDTTVQLSKVDGFRSNACGLYHSRLYSQRIGIHVVEDGASSLSLHGCTIEGSTEYGALIEEENCNLFDFGSHWENKDAPSHVKLARGGVFGNSRFNAIA